MPPPAQPPACELPTDVHDARVGLEQLITRAGWSGDVDLVLIAVQEALINADRHGGGLREVGASVHGDLLTVVVADHGETFSAVPYTALPPDPLAERGRGLWLIGQITDHFEVDAEPDGTRLTLTFRAGSVTAPAAPVSAPPPPPPPLLQDLTASLLAGLEAVAILYDTQLIVREVAGDIEGWFGLREDQAVGRDLRGLAAQIKHRFADPVHFEDRLLASHAQLAQSTTDQLLLADGRVLRRRSVPVHVDGQWVGRLALYLPLAEHSELVGALQKGLLPNLPTWEELEIGALYHPADASSFVGGDFYDFMQLAHGGRCIVVGDMSGRGPAAAAASTRVRAHLRATLATSGSTSAIPALERSLEDDFGDEEFVTLVLAVQEGPDVWSLVSCGHPPALIYRDGEVTVTQATGPLVGQGLAHGWAREPFVLAPGDVLLLYSDGVIDAGRGTQRFGLERLAAALAELGELGTQALVEAIDERIHDHAMHQLADDHVLVAVRRRSGADPLEGDPR
jgi:serine phosphatase RsbU (regulator of sigma subunit)/anti-sigma regulatory factor (Ser/Thr protein kinase)